MVARTYRRDAIVRLALHGAESEIFHHWSRNRRGEVQMKRFVDAVGHVLVRTPEERCASVNCEWANRASGRGEGNHTKGRLVKFERTCAIRDRFSSVGTTK